MIENIRLATTLQAVFGADGVLSGMSAGKGYVDMSTVDEQTSGRIAAAVLAAGGAFLEAPVSGSKKPAIDGQLIILAAGDKPLFDACGGAFGCMGKRSLYLGEVGAGARMKLVVNMVMGGMMGKKPCRTAHISHCLPFAVHDLRFACHFMPINCLLLIRAWNPPPTHTHTL